MAGESSEIPSGELVASIKTETTGMHVDIYPTVVRYHPPSTAMAEQNMMVHLNPRIDFWRLLRQLEIPGVHIPTVRKVGRSMIVERAIGYNLVYGENAVGKSIDFMKYGGSSTDRMGGMIAYLHIVEALNSRGYAFTDHQSDSVFVDPGTVPCTITVVDALPLPITDEAKEDANRRNPTFFGSAEDRPGSFMYESRWSGYADPWHLDRAPQYWLPEVLTRFFTRGIPEAEGLVPRGVSEIIASLAQRRSARDVIESLRRYSDNPTNQSEILAAEDQVLDFIISEQMKNLAFVEVKCVPPRLN